MKCAAAAVASVLLFVGVADASKATASFGTGTNITGSVVVSGGSVSVDIDLSNFNISLLPANCTVGGLRYHIHSDWLHSGTRDFLGATQCGESFTGGHYDPWLGCSSSSSNDYCNANGGCVNGSSALGGEDTVYSCNQTYYGKNPYACEVGDWSGKYGYLNIDSKLKGTADKDSAWEVDASDLEGRSVVFHCNDNTRAFCAPFEIDTSADEDSRDDQSSSSTSKVAKFLEQKNSTIILKTNGEVEVSLDLEGLTIPADCGDYLYYRVFTEWQTPSVTTQAPAGNETNTDTTNTLRRLLQLPSGNDTANSSVTTSPPIVDSNTTAAAGAVPTSAPTEMPTEVPTPAPIVPVNCTDVVGSFFDPTVTCAYDSQHTDYCRLAQNSKLCGDSDYSYSCNRTKDKFSCAPGDLSGKYGAIDLTTNTTTFYFKDEDELMIALELLEGKSAVLECANTHEIVACAQWKDYSEKSSSSSGSDETPVWVWIVVAVGAVLLIGGAVFLCRRCGSDDSYTKIQS